VINDSRAPPFCQEKKTKATTFMYVNNLQPLNPAIPDGYFSLANRCSERPETLDSGESAKESVRKI
jgi:hypothetical protein